MRARLIAVTLVLLSAVSLFAQEGVTDIYLSIGGSVNNFRTDARIFNPSYTKDISITARYLPMGNIDNSNPPTTTITIAKRSQAVYDDVVKALFPGNAILGAIRLTSADPFVATQRIYADEAIGTLGQFVPGLPASEAIRKGVLVQLKSNGPRGQKGTYRTNWGAVNPNPVVANISLKLYDKTNGLAGTNNLTLQPYGVFIPTPVVAFFGNPNRDLTDAWVSFESDQPIFAYSSILDNGSEDGTFIPAIEDVGVDTPPAEPAIVNIVASNFRIEVTQSRPIQAGDRVTFRVSQTSGSHGVRVADPAFATLLELFSLSNNPTELTVTMPSNGDYFMVCTNSGCGSGHFAMTATLKVGQ